MDPVQKMGDVREIFISKHRNKGGRRYGFVRFKVVSDERSLERKLDNIIVGGLKMYINVPKYRLSHLVECMFCIKINISFIIYIIV